MLKCVVSLINGHSDDKVHKMRIIAVKSRDSCRQIRGVRLVFFLQIPVIWNDANRQMLAWILDACKLGSASSSGMKNIFDVCTSEQILICLFIDFKNGRVMAYFNGIFAIFIISLIHGSFYVYVMSVSFVFCKQKNILIWLIASMPCMTDVNTYGTQH